MKKTFTVEEAQHELRLDKFLVEQFTDQSRSQIQKWIKVGAVLVNDKPVTKHFALSIGDVVFVEPPDPKKVLDVSEMEKMDVEILYEDDDIIVLNKPVGLLIHPAPSKKNEWTVANFLQEHFPAISEVGEDPVRPGIVHRLDQAASGVMVAAKTQAAFESIKQQFADRVVAKEYRAIVHRVPINTSDIIKLKIAHSTTRGGKMAARPEHEEGKDSWTQYDVLQSIKERYAYLSVQIKTGRTHQIRAHLAAVDHPIVGDLKYHSKKYKSKKTFPRLFLHAHELGFKHPSTGEQVSFTAPIPEEFSEFID